MLFLYIGIILLSGISKKLVDDGFQWNFLVW